MAQNIFPGNHVPWPDCYIRAYSLENAAQQISFCDIRGNATGDLARANSNGMLSVNGNTSGVFLKEDAVIVIRGGDDIAELARYDVSVAGKANDGKLLNVKKEPIFSADQALDTYLNPAALGIEDPPPPPSPSDGVLTISETNRLGIGCLKSSGGEWVNAGAIAAQTATFSANQAGPSSFSMDKMSLNPIADDNMPCAMHGYIAGCPNEVRIYQADGASAGGNDIFRNIIISSKSCEQMVPVMEEIADSTMAIIHANAEKYLPNMIVVLVNNSTADKSLSFALNNFVPNNSYGSARFFKVIVPSGKGRVTISQSGVAAEQVVLAPGCSADMVVFPKLAGEAQSTPRKFILSADRTVKVREWQYIYDSVDSDHHWGYVEKEAIQPFVLCGELYGR